MHRYEIAQYADLLPPERRDDFAAFALRNPSDRVRSFMRYQLQMTHQGFAPRAAPGRERLP